MLELEKETQNKNNKYISIPKDIYIKLIRLGLYDPSGVRDDNAGKSNYSKHFIQPWSIWLDYPELTPFDCDIIKRVLRTKDETNLTKDKARLLDYKKIIHICAERMRQIETKNKIK